MMELVPGNLLVIIWGNGLAIYLELELASLFFKRDVDIVFKFVFVFVFVFVLRRDMHVVFKCNVGEVNHRVPSMD